MKILMVGPIERSGGVSTHTKELVDKLKEEGNHVETYNLSPKREYPKLISNLIKLYKRTLGLSFRLIMGPKNFDVVHIQASGPMGGFIPAIIGALLKKMLNFNLVVTFHYSNTEEFAHKYKKILNVVINYSDKFILVSNKQKQIISKILKNSLFIDKMTVVPNGYDPLKLKLIPKDYARKKLNIALDTGVIVTVANLVQTKGHDYLIEALKKINQQSKKNITAFIIGKGPMYNKIEGLIKKYGLSNVILTGWVSIDELSFYLNAADIFVLPSLEEGNPTVMFEALGVGLPFVGTTVGGVPEIITSEDYGLLCPPKDPECLAEKILMALEKEWDREKIRRYAEQFTWEEIAKQTLKIYKKVLAGANIYEK